MYDQSFSKRTLDAHIRRSDFNKVPAKNVNAYRKILLEEAFHSAQTAFEGKNPIRVISLGEKKAYGFSRLEDELVVRKVTANIRRIVPPARGRDFIVRTIARILEEGVPYRIYRLDIRQFFESIDASHLEHLGWDSNLISPWTKRILSNLLQHYHDRGGTGVPRGIGLSAALAELLLKDFDAQVSTSSGIYFYARYVDDIFLISSGNENESDFLQKLAKKLPQGLELNPEKQSTLFIPPATNKSERQAGSVDYLGYTFKIFETSSTTEKPFFRKVMIDIAESKVRKIQFRIIRSFHQFTKDQDKTLLKDRLRYLTSNFTIIDKNTGRKKFAGIYHGYPNLDQPSNALARLDEFLRRAILARTGRLFSRVHSLLTSKDRREMLSFSFARGHSRRHFTHFHARRIGEIQGCWKHE